LARATARAGLHVSADVHPVLGFDQRDLLACAASAGFGVIESDFAPKSTFGLAAPARPVLWEIVPARRIDFWSVGRA
jgi:hypothetical protein